MASRGHAGPSRIIRHAQDYGSASGVVNLVDASLPPELAEKKLVAEVERLANENHRLATAQILLRRDLVCAEEEVQTVKAHIRSIQTECDIQIRILMEKIAKMEAECKNAANIKKEIEHARKEVQRLVVARQELADKVEQANKNLKEAQIEIKQLPDVLSVMDNMKEEHHRLRTSFDYEKEINIRKVAQLQTMEKEFIGMSREIERLQTEVINAEKSLQTLPVAAPYCATYQSAAPPVAAPYGATYQSAAPPVAAPYGATIQSAAPPYQSAAPHPVQGMQSNGYYHHPYCIPPPPVHMGAFPVAGRIPQPQAITPVHGMTPRPPTNPPVDETIPPPPPTPFDEMIPPPPPNDPPPCV